MRLRVICQICGATKVIDTKKPIGPAPRWENHKLEDFGIQGVWSDYEVWICPDCIKGYIIGWVANGEGGAEPEIDWEGLGEAIEKSLGIKRKEAGC